MTKERKSDLVCSCCERELEWRGSVMDGKMVCTTSWCVKNDEHAKAPEENTLEVEHRIAISQSYIEKISGGSGG